MSRKAIQAANAPAAIGPYSQAIVANGFVFVAGQIPIDPATGALVTGDVSVQTARVLDNVSAVLSAAGTSLANVVKTTVYLHSMADFAAMNTVYATRFGDAPPARATVGGVELPRGALVEIEAVALVS